MRLMEVFLSKHNEDPLLNVTSLLVNWALICVLELSSPLCVIIFICSLFYSSILTWHPLCSRKSSRLQNIEVNIGGGGEIVDINREKWED